ncbi:MAG: TolC family protein, partial [Alistipes sp.]|nr:TolC family protein [Alistipes sp.]
MKRLLLILFFAAMSVGCMPKLYAPRIATNDRYYNADTLSGDSLRLDRQWWRQFGDTTLSELVELALAQNRDLWVAASRIRQAEERLGVARASFLPQV